MTKDKQSPRVRVRNEAFARWFKQQRQKVGITMVNLAKAAGYSSYLRIWEIEHYGSEPRAAYMLPLAKALQVDVEQLLRFF